jgi:hypothetical protein
MRFDKHSLSSTAVLAAALAVAAVSTGCLSEAERGSAQPFCAPFEPVDDFRLVNNMLERRCGTLDCHGDASRPFIVFGQNAYRRPGGQNLDPPEGPTDVDQYYPGGEAATTEFELRGTYESICGLEPEKMDQVVKGEQPPEHLTLIRKPRLEEKHKGGRIWGTGTREGDACVISWLESDPPDVNDRRELNAEACLKELEDP